MKILNLVYQDKSDIKYKISKFPDGQQQITILEVDKHFDGNYQFGDVQYRTDITIKSRLNNFEDLELIVCATKSLRGIGFTNVHLYVPYFLGSRSDRQFEVGSNNYLKDIICPIINSLNFDSVTVLDPHSDVLEGCLNEFNKVNNKELVELAIYDQKLEKFDGEFIIVSPDDGASKKIYKLAEQIGYKGDIITCSKERDVDGKLTKTIFPFETHKYNGEDFIIIDDICDGGATFINIARKIKDCFAIREANQKIKSGKIYLVITHAIFSKGLGELQQYFDNIYTTNSYKDLNDCEPFVKQLNIF